MVGVLDQIFCYHFSYFSSDCLVSYITSYYLNTTLLRVLVVIVRSSNLDPART